MYEKEVDPNPTILVTTPIQDLIAETTFAQPLIALLNPVLESFCIERSFI